MERLASLASPVTTALAAIALVLLFLTLGPRSGPVGPILHGPCLVLTVTSSNEKSAALGDMAAEFGRTGAVVDDKCVEVKVVQKASGDAEQALARGWTDADGPRPDVWSPAATTWIQILRVHRVGSDRSDLIPDSIPSLIQSPLVIAMPRPMAAALGWPDRPIGWHEIYELARDPDGWAKVGHAEWGAFRLGKTDPTVSTSGLHALVGTYYAATSLSGDLTPDDVRRAEVVAFVKAIESSVEHYGTTAATFLANLKAADAEGKALSYVSAIAIEEKQIFDYDREASAPNVPLVAVYPRERTLVADHPYVVLRAPWVDDTKRRAAALFLEYLEHPDRQRRFQALGFRDHTGAAGPNLTVANGFIPSGAVAIQPPAPETLAAIAASWSDVRKRARVIMALDVSGSMHGQKIDLMRRSAAASLDLYANDDEVALWTFSTDVTQVTPFVTVGRAKDRLRAQIDALYAGGGTALYRAARDSVRSVAATFDRTRINAVVLLTDGQNSSSDDDVEALLRDLRAANAAHPIRVFTIAYGADADLATLRRISDATRAASYDAKDTASINKVFREVVSNF